MIPAYTQAAGLPDPDMHAEFYADVPLKRFLAFIVDAILIIVITVLLIPLTAFTALFFLGFLGLVVSFAYRTLTLGKPLRHPRHAADGDRVPQPSRRAVRPWHRLRPHAAFHRLDVDGVCRR